MDQQRLNALETALDNELKEREFYLKHAARTRNPLGRAMFTRIADEELEHYQRLRELQKKWQKDEKWPEDIPLVVAGSNLQETMNGFLAGERFEKAGDQDDLEAIRTAIDFEKSGVDFYEKLRAAASDPREKNFFALLAGIEGQHLKSLLATEAFFLDPAQWYQEYEHGGLDGA
ncbi:MAG: ferritin family protein [Deltaproteobacteria bacterium]|nr:ferritin family protein [Deltaproteobacteria bacterium]